MAIGHHGRPWSQAVLVVLVGLLVHREVAAVSCINFTSTVDGAGAPGPGSGACLPYNVEVTASADTVLLSNASAAAVELAPVIDVSVVVDESGSVVSLCSGSYDCYQDEKDFATELITLLNEAVGFFDRGGTALYMEYSLNVNVDEAYTSEADYIAGVAAQSHDGGGTYIGTAIAAAKDRLLALPGREDRSQMMVVMTDGHEGGGTDPAGQAALAAAAGITMYVVAVDVTSAANPTCSSSDFWPSCIDEPTMLEVAGAPERLFVVDTFAGLSDDVAGNIIAGIEVPCATDATFTVELDVEPVDVPEVTSGDVEVNGTTVTWTMDSVGESVAMTFAADYCQCEYQETTVDFLTGANYTDNEANDPGFSDLLNLTAQVTDLCTPVPTPAPTPSPTPGPSPQPTAVAPDTLFMGVIETADGAWEAVYTPDGTNVYLTGKETNSIVIFDVDPSDGGLTMVGESAMNSNSSAGETGALDGPTALATSPDGRCLFVAAVDNSSLTSLRVGDDASGGGSGSLIYAGSVSDVALADAWDVVVSPSPGDHVYVSSSACGCIMTFAADPDTCGLTYLFNTTSSLVAPAGMAVSPDGSLAYATDPGSSGGGALVVFSRDPETGELELLQTITDGEGTFTELGDAVSVAVSPSGKDVYVASSNPGALMHWCMDETSGELQAVDWDNNASPTDLNMDGASTVTVSPSNSRVLVASTANNTLWVLDNVDEDGGCAVLELQDTIREGDEGHITGLAGARSISVSPDGGTALVVSSTTGTIAVFRDTTDAPPTPTPGPTSDGETMPPPSDEDEWHEEYAGWVAVSAALTAAAAGGLVWLLVANGCCGCCAVGAAFLWRKKRVECPACGEKVDVKRRGLETRTSCSCDVLRAKAEAEAAGAEIDDNAGGNEGTILFHPDPKHVATCPHCKVVFCAPCDIRDKKRMFPFLFENSAEGGKGGGDGVAVGPSAVELGVDDAGNTPTSP